MKKIIGKSKTKTKDLPRWVVIRGQEIFYKKTTAKQLY